MAVTMNNYPRTALAKLPMAGVVTYLTSLALLRPAFSPLIGIWGEAANVGSVMWRFGLYGQLAIVQFYFFTALALAGLAAGALGHRKLLLALGAAATLLTLLLVAGGPFFALDYLQLKKSMSSIAFVPFKTTAFKVVAMAMLGVPVMALIAISSIQAARALRGDKRLSRTGPGSPVIGGRT